MTSVLSHRGPDGDSFWSNRNRQVLFGHRRLSIIDLSENGSQAMHYHDRYTIIYNGEIYNYLEIKEQLQKKAYTFASHSDTEVILAAYDCYREHCLDLFDGMFSFAIWDEQEQTLFAARDRFGEKPFYYVHDATKHVLWFASEIKALKAAGITASINPQRLLMYLGLGYTGDPSDPEATFFNNIRQLAPAHFLLYNLPGKSIEIKEYWKLNKEKQIDVAENSAIETFNDLLSTSIRRRLRSDVPLGTSLSGGLDSSTVTAMIHELSDRNIARKSFSAVFPGFAKDESPYIQKVRTSFGLESFSVTPTADDFANDFEKLLYHHEGPISSSSVYIQYKVFELAKNQNIKVLLDGQGADETLGGYAKYIHWFLQELLQQNKFSEFNSEKKALQANQIPFTWTWKNYAAAKLTRFSKKIVENKGFNQIKGNTDFDNDFLFQNLMSKSIAKPHISKLNDTLHFDTCRFGLNELLRYADRNSMAHGREVRLPFLSHELVEFVFSLPSRYKIHNGWTKWILRKAVEKKLPVEIVWRRDKIGFEPPQKAWMEHQLLKDYLYESKKILVKNRILKSTVLSQKNQPHDAYAADGVDWRYLVAGQLLK
jgi:asparagine synthase (glutamine-hydrolysing)